MTPPSDYAIKVTAVNAGGGGGGGQANEVNTTSGNGGGIGAGNANLDAGESLILEFDDEGISGVADTITSAEIKFATTGNKAILTQVTVRYVDGTVASPVDVIAEGTQTFGDGRAIDGITITQVTEDVRITSLTVFVADNTAANTLDFDVSAIDGDGDLVSAGLSVTIQTPLTLAGTGANDALGGAGGIDTLTGAGGNDVLSGNAGNDILNGGDGNDLLIGGAGNDTLIGGDGIDTASYVGASSAVNVNLANGTAIGGAGADTLSQIENVIGSSSGDTLIGDTAANVITGGAGSDTMDAGVDAQSDTFVFRLADKGTGVTDTIANFNLAAANAGGDVLDLRDLLQGESGTVANLDNYLTFSVNGGNTTIDVRSTPTGPVDQTIVLTNVDLSNGGTLNNDAAIIQNLLNGGKLITDGN